MFYYTHLHCYMYLILSQRLYSSIHPQHKPQQNNYVLTFIKIHLPMHCPVANDSDHFQCNFHKVSGFTNILLFCYSRPMNTCIKVFKLLSVSDGENPGNRKTLTQKYLASHLSVIRGCLLLYGGTFNSGFICISAISELVNPQNC